MCVCVYNNKQALPEYIYIYIYIYIYKPKKSAHSLTRSTLKKQFVRVSGKDGVSVFRNSVDHEGVILVAPRGRRARWYGTVNEARGIIAHIRN